MTFNSVGLGKIPEGIKHKCIYGNHPKKRIIYNLKHLKIIQALKILLYTYLSIALNQYQRKSIIYLKLYLLTIKNMISLYHIILLLHFQLYIISNI